MKMQHEETYSLNFAVVSQIQPQLSVILVAGSQVMFSVGDAVIHVSPESAMQLLSMWRRPEELCVI